MIICLDSNCFTYLIATVKAAVEPPLNDSLREEHIALVRLHHYCPGRLCITDTVINECVPEVRQNRPAPLDEAYEAISSAVFDRRRTPDRQRVEAIRDSLLPHHTGVDDCQILAEAIVVNADFLLTCDKKRGFIARLGKHSGSVCLTRPSDCWNRLAIPRGALLDKQPSRHSKLSKEMWWRW